jgi:hypothetical protein
MTDDQMTEHDGHGVQRLLLAVEDQLGRANDVDVVVEQMTTRAATMIPAGADREQFKRHFRVLIGPLVKLELERREES